MLSLAFRLGLAAPADASVTAATLRSRLSFQSRQNGVAKIAVTNQFRESGANAPTSLTNFGKKFIY